MHIAILSGGLGWHVRDLTRAAAGLGHTATALDFRSLEAGLGCDPGPLAGYQAAVVRTMPAGSLEQIVFRMDFLHAAVASGVLVLNPPRALETCINKFLTTARLVRAGIPSPETHTSQTAAAALRAFVTLGRDVVVKPIFGSEGRGIVRLCEEETAWRTFHALERTGQVIYQQRFISHPGWDLRAFVINDRVIAAMRRSSSDWRTNIARGATATAFDLTSAETELALRAADATGCPVAGVDLLPGRGDERYVIEVNAVPGWRSLAAVSGIDIAGEVVRHLVELYD